MSDDFVRDEGYIKFQCHWSEREHGQSQETQSILDNIIQFRQKFYALDLIGAYPDGIGFGNISQRYKDSSQRFLISGSATGNFSDSSPAHFSEVVKCIPEENQVYCEGPIIASSESMTHYMIFQLDPSIKVVVHVHHQELWDKYKHQLPTTGEDVPYGTPEMANEMKRLYQTGNLKETQCLAMAGHEEGLIAFGESFQEVQSIYNKLLNCYA